MLNFTISLVLLLSVLSGVVTSRRWSSRQSQSLAVICLITTDRPLHCLPPILVGSCSVLSFYFMINIALQVHKNKAFSNPICVIQITAVYIHTSTPSAFCLGTYDWLICGVLVVLFINSYGLTTLNRL